MKNHPFFCWLTLIFFLLSHFPNDLISAPTSITPESTTAQPSEKILDLQNQLVIPKELGTVQKSWQSASNASRPWVIHIQDLHVDYEAQKNVSAILKAIHFFLKTHDPSIAEKGFLVAVEGAEGKIDPRFFSSFPNAQVRQDTADYFLKKAKFTGPEFFSILHPEWNVEIFGIEDRDLYLRHKDAYEECLKSQEKMSSWLKSLFTIRHDLEKKVLSTQARELLRKRRKFEEGRLDLSIYAQFLVKNARKFGIPLKEFSNLASLLKFLRYEKDLNPNQIEKERNQAIEALARELPKEELNELVKKSLEYRLGRIDEGEYFLYLSEVIGKDRLKNFAHLDQYIQIVEIKTKLNFSLVFQELEKLQENLSKGIFKTVEEKEFLEFFNLTQLIEKLVYLKIDRKDLSKFKTREKDLNSILGRYEIPFSEERFAAFEDFYRIAEARDRVLFEKTKHRMKESGRSVAVLFTGGFHTEGLTTGFFEKNNISYTVITPKAKGFSKTTEELYQSRMLGSRNSFEEMLLAEIKSLHPGTLLGPLTEDPVLADRLQKIHRVQFEITAEAQAIASSVPQIAKILSERREELEKIYPEISNLKFFDQDIEVDGVRYVLAAKGHEIIALRFTAQEPAKDLEEDRFGILESGIIGPYQLQVVSASDLPRIFKIKHAKDRLEGALSREALRFLNTYEVSYLSARRFLGKIPVYKEIQLHKTSISFGGATYFVGKRRKKVYFFRFVKGSLKGAQFPERYSVEELIQSSKMNVQVLAPRVFMNFLRRSYLEKEIRARFPKDFFDFIGMRPTRPAWTDLAGEPSEDLAAAAEVLRHYDVGRVIELAELHGEITEHGTAIYVEAEKGTYVLRPISSNVRSDSVNEARFEISLVQHLVQNGFPTTDIIPSSEIGPSEHPLDKYFVMHSNGKVYLLYDFVEGSVLQGEDLTSEERSAMVSLLARLHRLTEKGDFVGIRRLRRISDFRKWKAQLSNLRRILKEKKEGNKAYQYTNAEKFFLNRLPFILSQIAKFQKTLPVRRYDSLPRTIIHGRFRPQNMVFKKNHNGTLPEVIGVFDWVDAREEIRVWDFLNGLFKRSMKSGKEFNLRMLRWVIDEYQKYQPLAEAELDAIPEILRAKTLERISSLLLEFTRLPHRLRHDLSGIPDEERALWLLDHEKSIFEMVRRYVRLLEDIDRKLEDGSFDALKAMTMKGATKNPYVNAIRQILRVAPYVGLTEDQLWELAKPKRVVSLEFPVLMDDGSTEVLKGYRVHHNDDLGPTKGGIRYHPGVSREEVKALATWMTIKNSIAGLPYGGGKGGIEIDPKKYSKTELARISRAYFRKLSELGAVGPNLDIPAPDVNTSGETMSWMVDEYLQYQLERGQLGLSVEELEEFENISREEAEKDPIPTPYLDKYVEVVNRKPEGERNAVDLGVLTGKPVEKGGSIGRTEATGQGVFYATQMALQKILKKELKDDVKIRIQGFGNVGSYTALFLYQAGAKITAVGDDTGSIENTEGIDIEKLSEYAKKNNGKIKGFPFATPISADQLLEGPCDVLIPAALENQITEKNADKIQASIVVEAANGPTTPEADNILEKRGVSVVPDVLANSGGVTVSYFEWFQNLRGESWTLERVNRDLQSKMETNFDEIYRVAVEKKVPMRLAAYIRGVGSVIERMMVNKLRGPPSLGRKPTAFKIPGAERAPPERLPSGKKVQVILKHLLDYLNSNAHVFSGIWVVPVKELSPGHDNDLAYGEIDQDGKMEEVKVREDLWERIKNDTQAQEILVRHEFTENVLIPQLVREGILEESDLANAHQLASYIDARMEGTPLHALMNHVIPLLSDDQLQAIQKFHPNDPRRVFYDAVQTEIEARTLKENALLISVEQELPKGERDVNLFIHKSLREQDSTREALESAVKQISDVISKHQHIRINNRSAIIKLVKPIERFPGDENPMTRLQVKGVLFDARKPLKPHQGKGVVKSAVFNEEGYLYFEEYSRVPQGGAWLEESLSEFLNSATLQNDALEFQAKYALGWGEFPGLSFNGRRMGFVVLGMNRETDLERGIEELTLPSMKVYGRMLRRLHNAGFIHRFPHPENISIPKIALPVFHDLGTLVRRDELNSIQDLGYLYWELRYGLLKLKQHLLDAPLTEEDKKKSLVNFFQGYFEDDHFEPDEFMITQFAGLSHYLDEYFSVDKIEDINPIFEKLKETVAGKFSSGLPGRLNVVQSNLLTEEGAFKTPGAGPTRAQGPPDAVKIKIIQERLNLADFENIPFKVVDSLAPGRENDFAHFEDGKILVRRDLWERIQNDPEAQRILRRHEYVENVLIPRLINEKILEESDLEKAHALTSTIDAVEEGTPLHSLIQQGIPLMTIEQLEAIQPNHPNDPNQEFYNAAQVELTERLSVGTRSFLKVNEVILPEQLEEMAKKAEKTHPELARSLRGLAREIQRITIVSQGRRNKEKKYDVYRAIDQEGRELDLKWPVIKLEVQGLPIGKGAFKAPGAGPVQVRHRPDAEKIRIIQDSVDRLNPSDFENLSFEVVDSLAPGRADDFAHYADGKILVRRDLWEKIKDDSKAQFILRRHEFVENVLIPELADRGVLEGTDLAQAHALTSSVDVLEEGTSVHALMQYVIPLMSDAQLSEIGPDHPNDPERLFYRAIQEEIKKRLQIWVSGLMDKIESSEVHRRVLLTKDNQSSLPEFESVRFFEGDILNGETTINLIGRGDQILVFYFLPENTEEGPLGKDQILDTRIIDGIRIQVARLQDLGQISLPIQASLFLERYAKEAMFDPAYPERKIHEYFKDLEFKKIGQGFESIVFSGDDDFVLKLPNKSTALQRVFSVVGRMAYWSRLFLSNHRIDHLRHFVKSGVDFFRLRWSREKATGEAEDLEDRIETYKIGADRLKGLVVPSRTLSAKGFIINTELVDKNSIDREGPAVLQQKVDKDAVLIKALDKALSEDDVRGAKAILSDVVDFQTALWRRGTVDSDFGKFFDNLVLDKDEKIKLLDIGGIHTEKDFAEYYVRTRGDFAALVHEKLTSGQEPYEIIEELASSMLDLEKREAFDLGRVLIRMNFQLRLKPELRHELIQEFFKEIANQFTLKNLESQWEKDVHKEVKPDEMLKGTAPLSGPSMRTDDRLAFKTPGTGPVQAQGPPDAAKIKIIQERLNPAEFENIPFEVMDSLGSVHANDFAHLDDGKILVRRDLWEKISNEPESQRILRRHEYVENVLISQLIKEGILEKSDLDRAHALTSAVDTLEEGTSLHTLMQHVIPIMSNEQLQAIQPNHPNDPEQIFYNAVRIELQLRLDAMRSLLESKIRFLNKKEIGARDMEAMEKGLTHMINFTHKPPVSMLVESIHSIFGFQINPSLVEKIDIKLFSDEGKNKRVYRVDVAGNYHGVSGEHLTFLLKVFRPPPDELSGRHEVTAEDRARAKEAAFPLQAAGMHPGMGPDVDIKLNSGEVVSVFSEGQVTGPTLEELRLNLRRELEAKKITQEDYDNRLEVLERSAIVGIIRMWLVLSGRYITDPTGYNLILLGSFDTGYRVVFIDLDRVTPNIASLSELMESLVWRYGRRNGKLNRILLDALVDVFGHDEAVRRIRDMLNREIPQLTQLRLQEKERYNLDPFRDLKEMLQQYLGEWIHTYRNIRLPMFQSDRSERPAAELQAKPGLSKTTVAFDEVSPKKDESIPPETLEQFGDLAHRLFDSYKDVWKSLQDAEGPPKSIKTLKARVGEVLTIEQAETLEMNEGIGERKTTPVFDYRPYRYRLVNVKKVERLGIRDAYRQMLNRVQQILEKRKGPVVVRIGGREGTGKSTFANGIAKRGLGGILPSEILVLRANAYPAHEDLEQALAAARQKDKKLIIVEGTYSLKGRANIFDPEAPMLEAELHVFFELYEDTRAQRLYQRAEKSDRMWIRNMDKAISTPNDISEAANRYLSEDYKKRVRIELEKLEHAGKKRDRILHRKKAKTLLIKGLRVMREERTREIFNFARVQNFIDRYTIDQERTTADIIVKNDVMRAEFGIFKENSDLLMKSMFETALNLIKRGNGDEDKIVDLLTSLLRNFSDNLIVYKIADFIQDRAGLELTLSKMDVRALQGVIRKVLSKEEDVKRFVALLEEGAGPVAAKKAMGEEDLSPEEFAKLREMTNARPSRILGREDFVRLKVAKVLIERQPTNEFLVEHQDIANALLAGEETLLAKPIQLGDQLFEKAKVEIHVVDMGEDKGFRFPGRSRPLYEWAQTVLMDGKAVIRVYVTEALLETHSKNPSILAQALIHPLVENIAGRTHLEAVQHEALYQEYEEEREEAQRGNGVLSDYSRWVLEEAAREGDWNYLRRMTEPYQVDLERYFDLSRSVNSQAYSISTAVTRYAWNLLFSNENLISSILKETRNKRDLLFFIRNLWGSDEGGLRPWIHDLLQNEIMDDGMVETLLKNSRISPLEYEMILDLYQRKLIGDLKNEGIQIQISDEILKKENHIRLLSSLKRFPNWLEEVNPQIALNRESTGSFRVRTWLATLRLDATELNKRFLERYKYLIGFYFVHLIGYNFINYLASLRGVTRDFMTPLDRVIPLIPEAGWIYYLFYPVLVLPAFLVKKVKDFRAAVGAYATALTFLFTVFLVYPARAPRPEINPDESLSSYLLHLFYQVDLPYNTTPSTHATLAFLTGLILVRTTAHAGRLVHLLIGTMIGLSTLFVRQHFVVDVISGWTVAYLSYKFWFDWRDRFANFIRSKMPRIANRLSWFKVPAIEKYPPLSTEGKDAEVFKDLTQLELTIDSSQKGDVALKKGKIYVYRDALENGQESLFSSLYNSVLAKISRAPADSLPEIILEDAQLDQRLGQLEKKDLVPLNSSLLDILGGEARLKPWFEELDLKYSFADLQGFLNSWQIHFVVPPGMMGDRSAYRLGTSLVNRQGEILLEKGDLLLNYGQFDFLLTQAALASEEAERHEYYRAAFALLLEAVHHYLYPQNLPDQIKKWKSKDIEGAFKEEKLRLMSRYIEGSDFDKAVWEILPGNLKLLKGDRVVKFYNLLDAMKSPKKYQKIARHWLDEGIQNVSWNRLSGTQILHGLNTFLQGPPRRFSAEFELKVFQDPLGVNQTILKPMPNTLRIEKFYPRDLALPKFNIFNDDEDEYFESSA